MAWRKKDGERRAQGAALTWNIVKDGLSAAVTGRFFHFYIQKREGRTDGRTDGQEELLDSEGGK